MKKINWNAILSWMEFEGKAMTASTIAEECNISLAAARAGLIQLWKQGKLKRLLIGRVYYYAVVRE